MSEEEQSQIYPPVRYLRFEAWLKRITEFDQHFVDTMSPEQWAISHDARLARTLHIALDDIKSANHIYSTYQFIDLDPENDPYRGRGPRGAELIDLLVQVTGIPKARKVIMGETFNRWWDQLDQLASTEEGPSISRSPAGVTWSAATTKGRLERAARDYIHTVEEFTGNSNRRIIVRTDLTMIELSCDDESDMQTLVREAERLTGVSAM